MPRHERPLAHCLRGFASNPSEDAETGADIFSAEHNARLVANAEAHYRSMMEGRTASWNLRDRHMADTLDALAAHLERRAPRRRDDRVLLDERDHLFGRVAYQQAAARGGDVITRSNDRRIEGALPGPLHDGAAGPRGDGSTTWTIDSSEPHVAAIALQRNGVRR